MVFNFQFPSLPEMKRSMNYSARLKNNSRLKSSMPFISVDINSDFPIPSWFDQTRSPFEYP